MTRWLIPTLLMILSPALVLANPFTDGQPHPAALNTGWTMPYTAEILTVQRQIHEALTAQIQALRDGASLTPLWLLLLFSFVYGVFHVLAPGHGKVIVSSYFLGHRARWRDGLMAGLIMAVGHTVTAVAIVVLLYLILGVGQLQVLTQARIFELVGYGLIALIGLWLFIQAWRNADHCAACGHYEHHHHHHSAHDHHHGHDRQGLGLFAATSLVPCTGSMIVLLFTLANQMLWAGLLAVLAIALGMMLAITAIALLAIVLHRGLTGDAAAPRWRQRLRRLLRLAAALAVIMTGSLLFYGTLAALQTRG